MKLDRDVDSGFPLPYISSRSSFEVGSIETRRPWELAEIGWFHFFQGEESKMGGEGGVIDGI